MRIAVVEHHSKPSLGVLGRVFEAAGAHVDTFWGEKGEKVPTSPSHDALVILGGAMNAKDDQRCPYFPDLLKTIRNYEADDRPVLGICLGAQLIARSYGAELKLAGDVEFGYQDIAPTQHASDDPVFEVLENELPMFQWHTDHYKLPSNATRLATNENYPNQAFRIGKTTYACQFHFEADRPLVEGWIETHNDMCDLAPGYEKWLPNQFKDFEQGSIEFCEGFGKRWLELID